MTNRITIKITCADDIRYCEMMEDDNNHNEVRETACLYTDDSKFHDLVFRLVEITDNLKRQLKI